MIVGHTKFAPDRLFSCIAKSYNASDVYNIGELVAIADQYATATKEDGTRILKWCQELEKKHAEFASACHPTILCDLVKVPHCLWESIRNILFDQKRYKKIRIILCMCTCITPILFLSIQLQKAANRKRYVYTWKS